MRFAFLSAPPLAALALAASALPAQAPPRLALASRAPVVVNGAAFRAGEAVRLTVISTTSKTARVRASRNGAFALSISGVVVPRCGGFQIRAVGALGSVASLKLPLPACMPAQSP